MLAFLYNFDVSKKRESLDERVSISFVMTFVEIVEIGNFYDVKFFINTQNFLGFPNLLKRQKLFMTVYKMAAEHLPSRVKTTYGSY